MDEFQGMFSSSFQICITASLLNAFICTSMLTPYLQTIPIHSINIEPLSDYIILTFLTTILKHHPTLKYLKKSNG